MPGNAAIHSWEVVKRYVLRHCAVVLTDEQSYLLEPRLASVAKQHHFPSVAAFAAAASQVPPTSTLGIALIDAMTTHETMFFRDMPFWKTLEKTVLPLLFGAMRGRSLQVWSAACSTGQEVYSLAMLLDECFPEQLANSTIYASDVSALAVEKARNGIYSPLEANRGLGAVRLQRHFTQAPGGFRIAEKLRDKITWSTHNLVGGMPDRSNCDLVLCRNVLIYFSETDRASVIQRLFKATRPGGVVGVGSTESILQVPALAPGLYENSGSATNAPQR